VSFDVCKRWEFENTTTTFGQNDSVKKFLQKKRQKNRPKNPKPIVSRLFVHHVLGVSWRGEFENTIKNPHIF
jgi:hypothetical protein